MAEAQPRLTETGMKEYNGQDLIADLLTRTGETQKQFLAHYGFNFVEVTALLHAAYLSVATKAAIIGGKTKAEVIAETMECYDICYKEAETAGVLKGLEAAHAEIASQRSGAV